jgi:hypothetical protein
MLKKCIQFSHGLKLEQILIYKHICHTILEACRKRRCGLQPFYISVKSRVLCYSNEPTHFFFARSGGITPDSKSKVKISLLQAVEAHRVARG